MKSDNKKQQKISYTNGWGEVVTTVIDGNYIGCDDLEILDAKAAELSAKLGISHDDAYKALTTVA